MGQSNPKTTTDRKWFTNDREWKLAKQAASNCNKTFAAEIAKVKKEQKGLSAEKITSWLKCSPNFIGCFAEDELKNLTVSSFPSFLIVNIDSTKLPGSHWIAIGIFTDKIEIFDALGFDLFNWSRVPCDLFNFLHRLSATREVVASPRLQSQTSNLCGFYAIYYVIIRKFISFEKSFSCFYVDVDRKLARNDRVLSNFFQHDD